MMKQHGGTQHKKQIIRTEAHARRNAQKNRERCSTAIFKKLTELPSYSPVRVVMCYVSYGSEVVTRQFLSQVWADGKRLIVPCCAGDRLELFELEDFEELQPGTLGILEPDSSLRGLADRRVAVEDLDFIVVPGLAFDRHGGRIGYGRGYYDRLLAEARPETALVAVAFECQMIDEVPMGESDVRVDVILTESAVYHRNQPRRSR